MGKRLPHTPKSQIRSALRQLFLRSRERASAIKRDKYTCQCCGAKQSRAKKREVYVEVHHKNSVTNWQALFDAVYEHLLCNPDSMKTLCKSCHKERSNNDNNKQVQSSKRTTKGNREEP